MLKSYSSSCDQHGQRPTLGAGGRIAAFLISKSVEICGWIKWDTLNSLSPSLGSGAALCRALMQSPRRFYALLFSYIVNCYIILFNIKSVKTHSLDRAGISLHGY